MPAKRRAVVREVRRAYQLREKRAAWKAAEIRSSRIYLEGYFSWRADESTGGVGPRSNLWHEGRFLNRPRRAVGVQPTARSKCSRARLRRSGR